MPTYNQKIGECTRDLAEDSFSVKLFPKKGARSMSMAPAPTDAFWSSTKPRKKAMKVRLLPLFLGEHVREFGSVIVEGWDKVVNPRERCGTKYRKWVKEFSEEERKYLGTWHTKMYHWEMRSGYPLEIGMPLVQYQ